MTDTKFQMSQKKKKSYVSIADIVVSKFQSQCNKVYDFAKR